MIVRVVSPAAQRLSSGRQSPNGWSLLHRFVASLWLFDPSRDLAMTTSTEELEVQVLRLPDARGSAVAAVV